MRVRHYPAGFTLIELLAVLVLIAIVAGFAAPRIDLARFEIQGGVQQVSTALMQAQRSAVKRQHNVVVAFDESGQTLRIHEDANNNGAIEAGETVRLVPLGEVVVFGRAGVPARPMGDDAISFKREQDGLPAVTFRRNGSTTEEGGFYLTSRRALQAGGRPQDSHAIEIERATGRITWFSYQAPDWRRGF
jgi:prepilin-type N-terminal cleavage/methylation domain-containing protein